MKKNYQVTLGVFLALLFITKTVFAMHIMEGFLPPTWGSKPKTPHFLKFEYIVKSLYHFSKTFPKVPYFGNVLTYVF